MFVNANVNRSFILFAAGERSHYYRVSQPDIAFTADEDQFFLGLPGLRGAASP